MKWADIEVVIDRLGHFPQGYRLKIGNDILTRESILSTIKRGWMRDTPSELAEMAVLAEIDFSGMNALGKRRVCLLCGSEVLCTKAGVGNINCCGQLMATRVPRPIPGSD